MKKVGILTHTYAANYGAQLQCYALQKCLSNLTYKSVQVIPYVPTAFLGSYYGAEFKEKKFDSFVKKFFDFKEGCITTLENIDSNFEEIIVGSDQVWNFNKPGYFLEDVPDSVKKVSYAASFGISTNNPKFNKDLLKKYLPSFDFLSVRELEHVEVVEECANKKCFCHADPTFLIDVWEYEDLMKKRQNDKEFLLFYWLEEGNTILRGIQFVNSLSQKYNLKVISVLSGKMHYSSLINNNVTIESASIEDFLGLIHEASIVVTNSYHGTIFSMLFSRPFYTYVNEYDRSRIDTLCAKFGIEDRIVSSYIMPQKMDFSLDYEYINERIEKEKQIGITYLSNVTL